MAVLSTSCDAITNKSAAGFLSSKIILTCVVAMKTLGASIRPSPQYQGRDVSLLV